MSWEKDIKEIKKREKLSLKQGGEEAINKQHAKGRKTLRERIDFILDKDSFDEIGKISGSANLNDRGELEDFTPANFLLGFGKINKRDIIIGGEDFTLKGGSPNPAGLRKSIYTEDLALKLSVKGLINLQFAFKNNEIYVLEVNPRASRTTPFVSKATNTPLARIAAQLATGAKLKDFKLKKRTT